MKTATVCAWKSAVSRVGPGCVAALTGFFVYATFYPLEWTALVWWVWSPLFLLWLRCPPRAGFLWGGVAGAVFWCSTIFWLTEVTWAGWLLLSAYCAVYTGAFGWAVVQLTDTCDIRTVTGKAIWLLTVPLVWAGLEFARSTFFTGFAWNPLGNSLYRQVALLQWATFTGVYGISAFIILINAALALLLDHYVVRGVNGKRAWHPRLMLRFLLRCFSLFLFFAFVVVSGIRFAHPPATPHTVRVAVIQPHIPQYAKWTPDFVDMIYGRLENLTRLAIQAGRPDLVIWPETAVPDYVRESRRAYELVRELTETGAPILVGSMDLEWQDNGYPRYFNTAILFDRQGRLIESYDKQHLVMFGEYVPLQRFLPFMRAMTPIEASFDAGHESTIFTIPDRTESFAVLICFEDTVSALARAAVRNGARLLVNQTNDAWFRESAAAWQHMTHSVLRAVENRVPVVRAANTGVSCGIDVHGHLHDVLADEHDHTFIAGFNLIRIEMPDPDMTLTFYTRHGDWFGWTGLVITLFVVVWFFIQRRCGSVAAVHHDNGTNK